METLRQSDARPRRTAVLAEAPRTGSIPISSTKHPDTSFLDTRYPRRPADYLDFGIRVLRLMPPAGN